MGNHMQRYMEGQAEVLQRMVENAKIAVKQYACEAVMNQPGRLVLVGSGSSYFSAQTVQAYLEKCLGLEVQVLLPSSVTDGRYIPQKKDLLVLITQEGKSVNVFHAAKMLEKQGIDYTVLTAMADSPIAIGAKHCLVMDCGEEKSGPKTKGVVSTMIMLTMLGLEMGYSLGKMSGWQREQRYEEIEKTIQLLPENTLRAKTWCKKHREILIRAPFISIISQAPICFIGAEGALKIVETMYIPTVSYEFEEFIHGPHCMLGTAMVVIGILGGGGDDTRLRSLCTFAREQGMQVLLISDAEEAEDFDGLRLCAGGSTCPLHFLLPFQVASAYLSEEMGHDLDRPKFQGFATRLESKLY